MRKIAIKKQREMLKKAINYCEESIHLLRTNSDSENPTVKPLLKVYKGRIQAFEACLDMLNGNPVQMNVLSE